MTLPSDTEGRARHVGIPKPWPKLMQHTTNGAYVPTFGNVVKETCGCVRVGGEIVSYCGGKDLFPETPEHICACPKCGITLTVPCAGEIVADVKIGGIMEVRCGRPS